LIGVAAFDLDGTILDGETPLKLTTSLLRHRELPIYKGVLMGLWGLRYRLRLPQTESTPRELLFSCLTEPTVEQVDAEILEIFADGTVEITLDASVRDNAVWLPRLGYEMELPAEHDAFTYYGHGPHESYCDMHHASPVGLYESDAGREYVPYIRPQEHGNHFGVKKLSIGDLEFTGEGFECCVSCYSTDAIYRAKHTDELVADGKIHLRVDYRCAGVGSGACGPELKEAYRLAEKNIEFAFAFGPKA